MFHNKFQYLHANKKCWRAAELLLKISGNSFLSFPSSIMKSIGQEVNLSVKYRVDQYAYRIWGHLRNDFSVHLYCQLSVGILDITPKYDSDNGVSALVSWSNAPHLYDDTRESANQRITSFDSCHYRITFMNKTHQLSASFIMVCVHQLLSFFLATCGIARRPMAFAVYNLFMTKFFIDKRYFHLGWKNC